MQKSDKINKTIQNIHSSKVQSWNKNRSFQQNASERQFEAFPFLSISGFKHSLAEVK